MLGLQWDSQPCLMHGWKEFAMAYNLEIQDQVVFLLFENSHFLVQVYDVNNKVKGRRIFASPVQVNMKAKNASQEETRAPYSDLPLMKAKNVSQAETRAPHSDVPLTYGVKTSGKKNVIVLDSSDEEKEKEKEDDQVRVKETPIDASTIGGTFSKMTLRSAKNPEEVGTQDHSMKEILEKSDHPMKDVSPQSVKKLEKSDLLMKYVIPLSVKKLEKSDHWMKDVSKEQKQEHVQLGGIMDRELGKSKRSDPAQNSAPSSPELIPLVKRSRRLHRKFGDYQKDDLRRADSVLRSGKLFKRSEGAEKLPPRLYEDAKEPAVVTNIAFQRVPGSEILTSCCSTQQSTMKKQQSQLLQESTSKITQPPVPVPELNPNNTESAPELTGPETPGGVPAVKPRPKVKVSIDGDKMRTEKLCLSEDEAYKRPTSKVGAPGKPFKLLYVSRRRPVTTQERQDTLAAARTFANKSTDKHCIMQLTTSQVYCGFHLVRKITSGILFEISEPSLQGEDSLCVRLQYAFYPICSECAFHWGISQLSSHERKPLKVLLKPNSQGRVLSQCINF